MLAAEIPRIFYKIGRLREASLDYGDRLIALGG